MLKINAIVHSARTESTEDKALKQIPAYRAPRVIEVGKASNLLQGGVSGTFRDVTNNWRNYFGY